MKVLGAIDCVAELAPRHNPGCLVGIRAARFVFGSDLPMVAVFDRDFHRSIPPPAGEKSDFFSILPDLEWHDEKLLTSLHRLHEIRQPIEDRRNEPPVFEPNWAFRQHRQWWAHRAISFPWFFGSVYALLLVWSVTKLLNP